MPKFKDDRISMKVNTQLKQDLKILALYHHISLTKYIKNELKQIITLEQNQEIIKRYKH